MRLLQIEVHHINGDDLLRIESLCTEQNTQPNGATTNDGDNAILIDLMLSDCVHTNSQRLNQRALVKADVLPQGDHASLRSYNILTEGAAPVISAQYFLILAQIIFTGLTELTVTATVLGLCGNTVANLKLRDGAANFTDLRPHPQTHVRKPGGEHAKRVFHGKHGPRTHRYQSP